MKKYICSICGYIYDEAAGIPDGGIAPGTRWADVPADWTCPLCGAAKSEFVMEAPKEQPQQAGQEAGGQSGEQAGERSRGQAAGQSGGQSHGPADGQTGGEDLKEMTPAQLSALCSNLAKGCEKQYLAREAEQFWKLAEYYQKKAGTIAGQGMDALMERINEDLEKGYPEANKAAGEKPDRGALRALTWSEKATRILNSLIARYQKEGDGMLENTSIYVCEICGFIYIGDTPPVICPICKVPNKKLTKVERG